MAKISTIIPESFLSCLENVNESGRIPFMSGMIKHASVCEKENGNAVIDAVVRARPATAKGRYLEGVTISATMSPGVRVDPTPYLSGV